MEKDHWGKTIKRHNQCRFENILWYPYLNVRPAATTHIGFPNANLCQRFIYNKAIYQTNKTHISFYGAKVLRQIFYTIGFRQVNIFQYLSDGKESQDNQLLQNL